MIHTTQTHQIGDNVELMREMESDSIDTIVTSPPYWGLRNYNVDGQIGLEPTLEEYHARMLEVTAECMRVLKPTGVMFWNHGDSYGGNQGHGSGKGNEHNQMVSQKSTAPKCMSMQNERLIIRMIDDQGWILRNRIIWNKPNGMPSSVTDRFSNKYEPVYMLVKSNDTNYYYNTKTGHIQQDKPSGTKGDEGVDWDWEEVGADYSESDTKIWAEDAEKLGSPRARVYREKKIKKVSHWVGRDYWFDLDSVRVPHKAASNSRWYNGGEDAIKTKFNKSTPATAVGNLRNASNPLHPLGKNPSDVWTIPTQPYPETHFATFPTALIEPMIRSACPGEICPVCGLPREYHSRMDILLLQRRLDRWYTPRSVLWLRHGAGSVPAIEPERHWIGAQPGIWIADQRAQHVSHSAAHCVLIIVGDTMDEYEKNMRCRNAKMVLNPEPRDDICVVYGRNVRDCDDCAFQQQFP
jgi:DNA modification methylase